MRGWVYVISNKSLPNLLKIGFSTKDPIFRANEFNGTGIPYNFEVMYDALVLNPRDVEQKVHKHLSNIRENKEWFRTDIKTAVEAIRLFSENIISEKYHKNDATEKRTTQTNETNINASEVNRCHFYMYKNCDGDLENYKGIYYCKKHNEQERDKRFSAIRQSRKVTE